MNRFSFLEWTLDLIRDLLQASAEIDSRWKDERILRNYVMPAVSEVWERVRMTADVNITVRHTISLVKDQEFYRLPPVIGAVRRVGTVNSHGMVITDWIPRGYYNPRGENWTIEGRTIAFRPHPQAAEDVDIFYEPSDDYVLHKGVGSLDDDLVTFTLAATPTLGDLDRRENAYAGSTLRLIPTTGLIQEGVIKSHDAVAGTVTVRVPFTLEAGAFSGESASYQYEIAPIHLTPMWRAIACRAALTMTIPLGFSQSKRNDIRLEYRSAVKAVSDRLTNMQMRVPDHFDQKTLDNRAFSDWVYVT